MNSYDYSSTRCFRVVDFLDRPPSAYKEFISKYLSDEDLSQLYLSCEALMDKENGDRYSEPMVWIGIYVALASFLCTLAMAADLVHGFRSKNFWFPCKYFSLNVASITVITAALKLPVDLSSAMPSYMDQETKLGSLAFMSTMMANLMPSLACMDNKTLLANVIGLSILVITVIVNVCIQINTSLIDSTPRDDATGVDYVNFDMVAYMYVAMVFLLLIIIISSSLTIPTSKEILDSKYEAAKSKSLIDDQQVQNIQMSTIDKLSQHMRRCWVMAETGCPQFVMASNPLSTTCGVICVILLLVKLIMAFNVVNHTKVLFLSPYKWSTIVIFIAQSIGVVVGTIAPILRCFSVFNFKLVTKWNRNYNFMSFKVDKYWTHKLHEWKQSPVPFLSTTPRLRSLVYKSKSCILSLCIRFQIVIVVSCKLIWLMATVVPIFAVSCFYRWNSWKARRFPPSITSTTDDIDDNLSSYVLQINNDMELAEKTLKRISNSMNSFILKAAKEQSNNLLELLKISTGFEGVEIFDTNHVQPLLRFELVNSWSLPIVTLTCITIALPNIPKGIVENLIKSVGEGLSHTHLVEESLNCSSEYVNLRKASMALWQEVENKCKWLDNPLAKTHFKGKTATEILKWFSDKAKEIATTEINESSNEELVENPPNTLIAANSMYRITQAILLRFQSNIEPITKKQLFAHLNGMIADIFSACFTNIPRVITMRCHESAIEKRESSVKVAAKLLGKTRKIIERLETLELPNMEDEKMAYIDEWRLYLKQSTP